jgi:hypothetical protein
VRVKIAEVISIGALQNALPSPLKTQMTSTDPIANAIVNFCLHVH